MPVSAPLDYFAFFVEYDGKTVRCSLTQTALLNRARVSTSVLRGRENSSLFL